MPGEVLRQWFIPGDAIDRHVISTDIQRYLGNDATVRPGYGTGSQEGVKGYWIKAYRNLTSAMIADLKADSSRWSREQQMTGTRGSHSPMVYIKLGITGPDTLVEPYSGSRTYETGSASRIQDRGGNSPSVDGPYTVPGATGRERGEARRPPPEAMQVDPSTSSSSTRYPAQPAQPRGYPQDPRAYQQDPRGYPPQNGRQAYQPDQTMSDAYGQPPPNPSYGQDPRYPPNYPQPNDGNSAAYGRPEYYGTVTSSYGQPGIMAPSRPDTQPYGQPPFGQPPHQGRDPRDPRYGQPEYADGSYAYPSPATTVSSVNARGREPVTSPPQQRFASSSLGTLTSCPANSGSAYGAVPPQYDQYGRPVQPPQNPYGSPDTGYQQPVRDPNYGRERQPAAPTGENRDARDARRRRLH